MYAYDMNLTRWKHVSYIFMIDYMHHNNLTGTFLRRADIILQKTTTNRQKGQNIKNRFGSFQKIHFQEDALISSRNCAYFNLFRNVYSRNISQFKSPLTPCFFFFFFNSLTGTVFTRENIAASVLSCQRLLLPFPVFHVDHFFLSEK